MAGGQRRTLFQLTLAAGQLGPEDAPAREAVVAGIRSFIDAAQEHADHEDRYLGPLHVEAGTATAVKLHADHAALKAELAALQKAADAAVAAPSPALDLTLYRALARFTGEYLAHVDLEESSMAELWARHDDATLAAVQGRLVAAHRPHVVQYNLSTMLPAASSGERVRFLGGLKHTMPPPVFERVRGQIAALLEPREWAAIDAA